MTVAALPIQPAGSDLENLARDAIVRYLGLRVSVNAPTWRALLFGGGRIKFKLPTPPDGALAALDRKIPEASPGDPVAELAVKLLAALQDDRPQGMTPRSMPARKQLPPPRDAVAGWLRRVALVACGPALLRLLAGAGYLTEQDIDTIEAAYPHGLDDERRGLVEAGGAVTAAGARTGIDVDLPNWLNDQVLTLMGERRPTDFFDALYDKGEQPEGAGPGGSAPHTAVVDNTAPTPSPEGPR